MASHRCSSSKTPPHWAHSYSIQELLNATHNLTIRFEHFFSIKNALKSCFVYFKFSLLFLDLQEGNHLHEKSDSSDEGESENQAKNFTDSVTTGQESPANKELIHKMFLLRFKLLQFVNSIHTHFMTRVSLSSF